MTETISRDAQAGRPSWSLAPQSLSIAYGEAQFMPARGAPAATAGAPKPEEPDDRRSREKTVPPSEEDLQRLVEEHSDPKGLPLTTRAAKTIVQETQPAGTKATIVGKNVARPDIIYENSDGVAVRTVEVKTAKNLRQAERAVRNALNKRKRPDVVALQAPSDVDVPRFMGKIKGLSPDNKAGKAILVVDPDSNVVVPLRPFP